MNGWLIVTFNLLILVTWGYLLYLVYNLDPKIQDEWKGVRPAWADEYNSFITSVKVTSFINAGLIVLTIITTLYKQFSVSTEVVGGRRHR